MRVLVCGGRDFKDAPALYRVLDSLAAAHNIDCIIEGDARGADRMAGYWAKKKRIDLRLFPADWQRHGKAAGPIRNQQMIDEGRPDIVLAFPGGAGTTDMMKRARAAGIEVVAVGQSTSTKEG